MIDMNKLHEILENGSHIYCDTIGKQRALMGCLHDNGIYGDPVLEEDVSDGKDCWVYIGGFDGQVHGWYDDFEPVDCTLFCILLTDDCDDSWDSAGSAIDMLI